MIQCNVPFIKDLRPKLGPKIWALTPDDLKNIKTFPAFKSRLKRFNGDNCPCIDYIHGVGYIN